MPPVSRVPLVVLLIVLCVVCVDGVVCSAKVKQQEKQRAEESDAEVASTMLFGGVGEGPTKKTDPVAPRNLDGYTLKDDKDFEQFAKGHHHPAMTITSSC